MQLFLTDTIAIFDGTKRMPFFMIVDMLAGQDFMTEIAVREICKFFS